MILLFLQVFSSLCNHLGKTLVKESVLVSKSLSIVYYSFKNYSEVSCVPQSSYTMISETVFLCKPKLIESFKRNRDFVGKKTMVPRMGKHSREVLIFFPNRSAHPSKLHSCKNSLEMSHNNKENRGFLNVTQEEFFYLNLHVVYIFRQELEERGFTLIEYSQS